MGISYPFCFSDLAIFVHISNVFQRFPNLFKKRFCYFIFWAVNFPATHEADLIFGPKEVAVCQESIMIKICKKKMFNLNIPIQPMTFDTCNCDSS